MIKRGITHKSAIIFIIFIILIPISLTFIVPDVFGIKGSCSGSCDCLNSNTCLAAVTTSSCSAGCTDVGTTCQNSSGCVDSNTSDNIACSCESTTVCTGAGSACDAGYLCESGSCNEARCPFYGSILPADTNCYCGSTLVTESGKYCCLGVVSDSSCLHHTKFDYAWYQKEENIKVTSGTVGSGDGNFSVGLDIFVDGASSYNLCNTHNFFCDYMKSIDNSDDLSDYYLFFTINTEFDNITYGDPASSFTRTFGVDNVFIELLDYRNKSVNFCDPDAKGGSFCGPSCKIGYDLSNEGKTWGLRKWDGVSQECCGDDYNRGGITRPDFLYQHVDEPDFSKGFCNECPLGLDLNNPGRREWNNIAKCCGDDDGQWYINYNLSGMEVDQPPPDGFNNKADCAKLVSNSEYLCNLHRTPNNQSKWYNAVDEPGEIAYIPCVPPLGFEAVSDGSTWIRCGVIIPKSDQVHQFTGDFFQEEKRINFADGWKHSYFCIAPPSEAGIDTIYECCGSRSCKSSSNVDPDGGIQASTGYAFNYGTGSSNTHYCTYQSDTHQAYTDLIISSQLIKSTLWATDLDLTNKASCESANNPETQTNAGYTWTGKDEYHLQGDSLHNFCCSENDDNELPYEFYNDPSGIGACFSSVYQQNKNFINYDGHTYNELYVLNGSIQGCAIDDYAAIGNHCSGPYGNCTGYAAYISPQYYPTDTDKPYDGSFPGGLRNENNFLLDLNNWPDPAELDKQGILIEDHMYCNTIDQGQNSTIGKYYCSYSEIWKETEGNELTHLSFTEWQTGEGEKRAECCQPTQCWDGQECIDSQHSNSVSPPFRSETDGYRCIFGEWYNSYLKYDWNNLVSGWCPKNDQCLVNPSGIYDSYDSPQCITSGEFVGDHYCENGIWTSRTKFLALQLLRAVEGEEKYTIYCDDYAKTLNTLDYEIFTNIEAYINNQRQPRSGLPAFNSVNNFCILRYGDDDKVSIATSLNHQIDLDDLTNFLYVFEEPINCPLETNGFEKCGASNTYYNSNTNSIIYSKTPLSLIEPEPSILIFFQDMFEFIFGWQPTYNIDLTYEFIQETKDFKKLYISNQEQIVAVTENVWPSTGKEHITVKYSGIGADICNSIEAYDESIGTVDYLQCNESQGTHYVISGLPEGINLWSKLTSKLRPQP